MEGVDVVTECKKTIENVHKMEDEDGKNAAIWILGEFGEQIATAPYILEIFVDQFNELSASTKTLLLISCVKLFGKRPPECQIILGDLIALCVEQQGDPQLRFRALFYYKLMKKDLQKTFEIVNAMKEPVDEFLEVSRDTILSDQLFEEFHTLAVIYGKPCSSFPIHPTLKQKQNSADDSDDSEESEEYSEEEEEEFEKQQVVQHSNSKSLQFLSKPQATIDPAIFEKNWTTWEIRFVLSYIFILKLLTKSLF